MCGITGKIYFDGNNVLSEDIEKMNQALLHRGPDDGGIYVSPDSKVGLGHRRLSIIDLSPLGHQPMSYMDRYWIVFNGEIYNFQENRSRLIELGYKFKSKTDTEVIAALYDHFGRSCLDHLRGMFAFAIYDHQEKTVFCARDRVGKKPFKYYLDEKVFIFASELKAILTQKDYLREPDYLAIHHFLTLNYCPSPFTGFKNIKKLEPAHYLYIDLKKKTVEKQCYWKLDYSKKLTLSEEGWKSKILEKLEESVKLRMISDVPLGAFLSGGIDSSAVVSMMARSSASPIKTFSIGFKEEKYNELKYAKIVADKFSTHHTEFIVEPHAMDVLPDLVRLYEEPFADSSALPSYYVSKLTRDHVTVALNGDGGDENFSGYGRYSVHKFALWYEKFMPVHKLMVIPAARQLADAFRSTFFKRALRFAETLPQPYSQRYLNYIYYFGDNLKNSFYTDEFKRKIAHESTFELISGLFQDSGSSDKIEQAMYSDFVSYLPDNLLTKADIASMAVSLETRSPFLDHEMLELTAQIPIDLKLKGLNNKKYILKEALRGIVPDEVMFRPKMGFSIPIDHWFRGELKEYTKSMLLPKNSFIGKILNQKMIEQMIDEHTSTNISHAYQIWSFLTLEMWFKQFFEQKQ